MANYNSCKWSKHDDYMTPKSAWEAITKFIPKGKVIWEPFYGDGKSGEYLRELGFNVIHNNNDFFENNEGDIIISNPPFSKYKSILHRLKELDKPFILLLPSQKINTKLIRDLFKDALQIIIPAKRIQCVKIVDGTIAPDWKPRCNFDCFYYCYKINLPNSIIWL